MGLVSPEFVQQHVASLQNRTSWQQQYSALAGPDVMPYYTHEDGGALPAGGSSAARVVAGGALSPAELKETRKGWSYGGVGVDLGLGGAAGESAGE